MKKTAIDKALAKKQKENKMRDEIKNMMSKATGATFPKQHLGQWKTKYQKTDK